MEIQIPRIFLFFCFLKLKEKNWFVLINMWNGVYRFRRISNRYTGNCYVTDFQMFVFLTAIDILQNAQLGFPTAWITEIKICTQIEKH